MSSEIVIVDRRLPFLQRLAYGIGHVQNDLSASMWFSYLIIYFHLVRLFNNKLAGCLMLIGQISDAMFTPFIGLESDRTKGIAKLGKRKTWHFIGTICVACSFPFVFNECITCSKAPDWAQFIYYAPFVVVFQFGWASTQISHLSLIPDLTSDEHERVELNGLRNAFTVLSNIIVFGVAWLLFDLHDSNDLSTSLSLSDSPKFQKLVFIVMGIGLLFSFIFHIIVREKQHSSLDGLSAEEAVDQSYSSIEKSMLKKTRMSWREWIKEKQFYQIALIYMCTRLFVNVSQIYLPLYITETLQMPKDAVAIMPLVVYISGLITSLLMKTINKKIGRKATYFIGQLVGLGCCVWIYLLTPDNYKQVYGASVCLGIGGTTMLVTSLAMTADLIANNVESGAFVYGAMSFTDKLSNGVAVLVIQQMHPCENCCPGCASYYKDVLTFVPGGVIVVGFIVFLTLLPQKIGSREKTLQRLDTVVNVRSNGTTKPVAICTSESEDSANERDPLLIKKSPSINS